MSKKSYNKKVMIKKGSGKNTRIHQRDGNHEQATYLSEILMNDIKCNRKLSWKRRKSKARESNRRR